MISINLSLCCATTIVYTVSRFKLCPLRPRAYPTLGIIKRLSELVGDRAALTEASVSAPELHQSEGKYTAQVLRQDPIIQSVAIVTEHITCTQAHEVPHAEPFVGEDAFQGNGFTPVAIVNLPVCLVVDMRNLGIGRIYDVIA